MAGYATSAQFYKALIDSKQMSMDDAARHLVRESRGGLTALGARDVISNPIRTAVELANIVDECRSALDRLDE